MDPRVFSKATFAHTLSQSKRSSVKDTTVIPITNFEILNFKDKATDDLTINSPPITSKKKPKKISIKFIYLIIILCLVTLELFEIFNTYTPESKFKFIEFELKTN